MDYSMFVRIATRWNRNSRMSMLISLLII